MTSVTLELAAARHELGRTQKERDSERAALLDLKRVDEDREEEVAWEKAQRRRVEEQKKLADLALAEYAVLVARLDPSAVPPPVPRRTVSDDVLSTPPFLKEKPAVPPKENGRAGKEDKEEGKKEKEGKDGKDEVKADAKAEAKSESKPETETDAKADQKEVKDDAIFTLEDESDKDEASTPPDETVLASADAISNLLIGQRGVHRLFQDFTSVLSDKDREIHTLQAAKDKLDALVATLRAQLDSETRVRVDAQTDRDRVLRDDASAAKVVERYMTFSQKSHETVHRHLAQQRQRAAATHATLRAEAAALRRRNRHEAERSTRLRAAAEEMASELGRESAGRRREVALRLGHIAEDEARARAAETWVDHVRRARAGAGGEMPASTSPDYPALVDEALALLAPPVEEAKPAPSGGFFRSRFLRRRTASPSASNGAADAATTPTTPAATQEESLSRVFLAEELVQTLVADLQAETERRVELEKQRVAWLAAQAEAGVPPEEEEGAASGGGMLFDADNDEEKDKGADETTPLTDAPASPSPPPPPSLDELNAIFAPVEAQYLPLQKSLHDQSVSLKALRSALPDAPGGPLPASSPLAPVGSRRAGGLRALSLWPTRTAQDDLLVLLDSLHEVIEDARVDVEIALADEERQRHGFAALLGVGASGVVQAASVLRDARTYADGRMGPDTPNARFSSRVADVEHDLATIKRTLHEMEGMDAPEEEPASAGGKKKKRSPFAGLQLRTVSALPLTPRTPHTARMPGTAALANALAGDDSDDDSISPAGPGRASPSTQRTGFGVVGVPRPGMFASVGRSLSSSVVGAATGVARAPGRVGELAGGLYRPRAKDEGKKEEDGKGESKAAGVGMGEGEGAGAKDEEEKDTNDKDSRDEPNAVVDDATAEREGDVE